VRPTISAVSEVEVNYPIRLGIKIKDGFAISSGSKELEIFDNQGLKIKTHILEGNITQLIHFNDSLIVVTSSSNVSLLSDDSKESIFYGINCNHASSSGGDIFLSVENGDILVLNQNGDLKASKNCGELKILHTPENSNSMAIARDDGTFIIMNHNLEVLQYSPPAEDDIEVITHISSNSDGVFVVSRSSLGVVVDDRPVNRAEIWDSKSGLLGITELPSQATSSLAMKNGFVIGCFEGELLWIGSNQETHLISNQGYSVTGLLEWEGDVIASSWFYSQRMSLDGHIKWNFEHPTLISGLLNLGGELIALIGDNKKVGERNYISLIGPNNKVSDENNPRDDEILSTDFSDPIYSGLLSETETAEASERNSIDQIEEIISDIKESLVEPKHDEEQDEDILRDLVLSAKSINIPPVADAGEDITITSNDESKADVILDGSKSYDPDGEIVSWSWNSEIGRLLGESPVVKVRLSPGVHIFSLTVVDNKGAKSVSSMTVRVV